MSPPQTPGVPHALATLLAAAALLIAPAQALAAGFAIGEQGAASGALAGAATARPDLPEAGFYNPAGYVLMDAATPWSARGVLGLTLIRPRLTHTSQEVETRAGSSFTPLPRVHLGGGTKWLGASASFDVPFGSSIDWGRAWPGRHELTSSSLQVLEFGANLASRPHRLLALSAGARLQTSALEIKRRVDVAAPERDARVHLLGEARGLGLQASLLVMPLDSLTFGLTYRSRVTHDFKGVADFEDIPIELEDRAHDTPMSARFVMPSRLALGGAFDHATGVVSADLEVWGWQTTRELVIDFEDEGMEDVRQPREWERTVAARVGYEHRLLAELLRLRVGAALDASPVPDETVGPSSPDGRRLTGSLGAGYVAPFGLSASLGVSYTRIMARDAAAQATLPGRYEGDIFALSFDVGFAR